MPTQRKRVTFRPDGPGAHGYNYVVRLDGEKMKSGLTWNEANELRKDLEFQLTNRGESITVT